MNTILWSLLGFALGSLPFSVWVGRLISRVDIRRYGDGNPGAANAFRAGGWRSGALAVTLDGFKGAIPVGVAHYLYGIDGWVFIPVILAPVLGHMFSPWLGGRGGKAVAVTAGVWCGAILPWGLLVFVGCLLLAWRVQTQDAWSVILTMAGLLVFLLLWGASAALLAAWAGNTLFLAWTHRKGLMTRPGRRTHGDQA